MLDEELLGATAHIAHIPAVVGAVVRVYNVPGVRHALKFSGPVLADMFRGRMTNSDDPTTARLERPPS